MPQFPLQSVGGTGLGGGQSESLSSGPQVRNLAKLRERLVSLGTDEMVTTGRARNVGCLSRCCLAQHGNVQVSASVKCCVEHAVLKYLGGQVAEHILLMKDHLFTQLSAYSTMSLGPGPTEFPV